MTDSRTIPRVFHWTMSSTGTSGDKEFRISEPFDSVGYPGSRQFTMTHSPVSKNSNRRLTERRIDFTLSADNIGSLVDRLMPERDQCVAALRRENWELRDRVRQLEREAERAGRETT